MRAFLFAPSNQLIGKLDVSSVDEVAKAVGAFVQGKDDIPNFSYVECGKGVWTITSVSPFQIVEGKVENEIVAERKSGLDGGSRFPVFASDVYFAGCVTVALTSWGLSVLLLWITTMKWLKTGQWLPVETDWAFKMFPKVEQWIVAPRDWMGLAKVLGIVSQFPWVFLVAGALTLALFSNVVLLLCILVIIFGASISWNI